MINDNSFITAFQPDLRGWLAQAALATLRLLLEGACRGERYGAIVILSSHFAGPL